MVRYSEMFNQPLNITYLTDTGAFICLGNPENGFYIPDPYEFLDIDLIPDYSELSIHEVRALAGSQENPATSTLPSNIDTSITVSQARSHVQALKDKAAQMEKELDDARNCRTGELAEMKAALRRMEEELYEKKSALMAELNAKKEEMEAKIDQMNRQVYLLESEI